MTTDAVRVPLDELLDALCPVPDSVRLQKPSEPLLAEKAGAGGHCFVPLSLVLKSEDGLWDLYADADCILTTPAGYIVEEALVLSDRIDEDALRDRSLLRAHLLALALCRKKGLSSVTVRFSVCVDGRWEQEDLLLSEHDLSAFLQARAGRIFTLCALWRRDSGAVAFPHASLRRGQKEFMHAVWRAVKSGSSLMACAPTGIGKTVAVLYPALKALEKGMIPQVYYASPKNTPKSQAADAVDSLQQTRLFRTLVLSAKMTLCPRKIEECEKETCPYADQFYKHLPEAIAYLVSFPRITAAELVAAAERFVVCPFDLALKMQRYCQVVIGDYNHVFDPQNAPFSPRKGSILLVDEAHNLPARWREKYTQRLARDRFDFFFDAKTPASVMLREHFGDTLAALLDIENKQKDAKTYFSFSLPEKLVQAVDALLPKVRFAMHDGFGVQEEAEARAIRSLYQDLSAFSRLAKLFGASFATLYPPEGGVALYLVDPRDFIRRAKKNWRSVVFFSATLLPRDYYFDLLGGEEEDTFLDLPSPFLRDNLFVGLCDVDVSYSMRFQSAPKICHIIHTAASVKQGHYMVFLPSFEYLRLIVHEYKKTYFHDRILVQERDMRAGDRNAFLSRFRQEDGETLIGFCVLGGVFAEGIDLKGASLEGEIIVGTGFPPPSPEAQAQSAAYCNRELDGKNFAYTLPGFSRVLQAAGRVIRDENDRGFLILCDTRYFSEGIDALFPESWEDAKILERDADLKRELEVFWQ